jgi:hypothetical protein
MLNLTPGGTMAVAPEVTATDVATFTTGNVAVSGPRWPAVTACYNTKISAKSAAHVAAAALMWLIVLAVITVV